MSDRAARAERRRDVRTLLRRWLLELGAGILGDLSPDAAYRVALGAALPKDWSR